MVRFIVALLALLASTAAMAEPQRQTFKDANGRTLGRSSTDARGNTTYYTMGRNTGGRSPTPTATPPLRRDGPQHRTVGDRLQRQHHPLRQAQLS
jgi:hypothetical protein